MTSEFPDEWMPLEQYTTITGDKPNNVHARVSIGVWQRGKHVSAPDGGKVWVNIKAVLEWVTSK